MRLEEVSQNFLRLTIMCLLKVFYPKQKCSSGIFLGNLCRKTRCFAKVYFFLIAY